MPINLITSNVDSKYISSSVKESIEQLRQNQNDKKPDSKDPAYTVELSDEGRALSNQLKSEKNEPSLFTKAGRTKVSQGYDEVFNGLLATHDENEAIKLFDEYMRQEGFERDNGLNESITAPISNQLRDTPDPRGLSTHSNLTSTVVNGEGHVLAATWATYNASSPSGDHTYRKKIADSFDLAADTVKISKGNSYSAIQQGKSTDPKSEALWNKVDDDLEKAATTGSLIDSTITEEDFTRGLEEDKNTVWKAGETDMITVTKTRIKEKSNDIDDPKYRSTALDEIMAKFRSLTQNIK